MERYLTVSEVAHTLRVSADTVRRWLRAGKLQGLKFGQVYRVPASALSDRYPRGSTITASSTVAERREAMERVLALAEELWPVIEAGTLTTVDPAQLIDASREE